MIREIQLSKNIRVYVSSPTPTDTMTTIGLLIGSWIGIESIVPFKALKSVPFIVNCRIIEGLGFSCQLLIYSKSMEKKQNHVC